METPVPLELTTKSNGIAQRYRLEETAIEIDRGKGPKRVELAQVKRVTLASIGNLRACELGLRDGTKTAISAEDQQQPFKQLVEALHQRLVKTGNPIEFVRGSWLVVGVLAAIGALAILTGLALYLEWVVPPAMLRGKALLIMLVGIVWVFVGPLLVWRSRPRSYDPTGPLKF